jgi:hypothetical protein
MTEQQRLLADVMERYGESWAISRADGLDAWTAVCRPAPAALHVLVAHSLPELSEKLAKASGAEGSPGERDVLDQRGQARQVEQVGRPHGHVIPDVVERSPDLPD